MNSIKITKYTNFNFLFWNCTIERFNTRVVVPNSTFGFKVNKDLTFFMGKTLITITQNDQ